MMPRSKKLLGSGDQEYFNEKRPVNVRVDSIAHLAELFPSPARDADEYPAITVVLSEWSATRKLSLDHTAKSWQVALPETDQPSRATRRFTFDADSFSIFEDCPSALARPVLKSSYCLEQRLHT